jgi:hypothetical protein
LTRGLAPLRSSMGRPYLFDSSRGADTSARDTYGLGGLPALRDPCPSAAGCLAQGKVILAASTFRRLKMRWDLLRAESGPRLPTRAAGFVVGACGEAACVRLRARRSGLAVRCRCSLVRGSESGCGLACDKAKDHGYPHELWTTRLLARHARENAPAAPARPAAGPLAEGRTRQQGSCGYLAMLRAEKRGRWY